MTNENLKKGLDLQESIALCEKRLNHCKEKISGILIKSGNGAQNLICDTHIDLENFRLFLIETLENKINALKFAFEKL